MYFIPLASADVTGKANAIAASAAKTKAIFFICLFPRLGVSKDAPKLIKTC